MKRGKTAFHQTKISRIPFWVVLKDAISSLCVPFVQYLDNYTPRIFSFLSHHKACHNPTFHHPCDFWGHGSPTQTFLGRQCSWRQACRLAPGSPAPEVAPGGWDPAARPATPPRLCSRSVTSGPAARQSPCPLPNCAAPPVLCTLAPCTTHTPGRREKQQPWSAPSSS